MEDSEVWLTDSPVPIVTCQRRRAVYISADAGRVSVVSGAKAVEVLLTVRDGLTVRGLCFSESAAKALVRWWSGSAGASCGALGH
jgi:hypothetical protein